MADDVASFRFRLRHDTAANWTSQNPILAAGEPGVEVDTHLLKVGDGSTVWNSLDYTGDVGPAGPAPSITVPTATVLAPTEAPTAVMSGTTPNYTLSFSLPAATLWRSGSGAPAGSLGRQGDWYVDTASANFTFYEKTGASTWTSRGTLRPTSGVSGPVSSVSGNLPSFNGTGGNTLQDSGIAASDVARRSQFNTFTQTQVFNSGGNAVQVSAGSADNAFMSFFARTATPAVRTGYVGFGGAATTTLAIVNEISAGVLSLGTAGNGNINLNAGSGNINLTGVTLMQVARATSLIGGGGSTMGAIPVGPAGTVTPQVGSAVASGLAAIGAYVNDGTRNRRVGLFVNDTDGLWGLAHTATSGTAPFVINIVGTEMLRVSPGTSGAPRWTMTTAMNVADGVLLSQTTAAAGSPRLFFSTPEGANAIYSTGGGLVLTAGAVPGTGSGTGVVLITSAGMTLSGTHTVTGAITGQGLIQQSSVGAATGFMQYNTVDQATNYERSRMYWASNVFVIGSEAGGTGTARTIQINSGGTALNVGSTGAAFFKSGTAGGIVNITSVGLTASSGVQNALLIDPVINQTGTAGYYGIRVNVTETAVGSGVKRLLSLGVSGVERLYVDNGGRAQFLGTAGNSTIIGASATGDSTSRFLVDASGYHQWGPGNAAVDTTLYRRGIGQLATDGTFYVGSHTYVRGILDVNRPTAGDVTMGAGVTGDAQYRFNLTAAGTMAWGPGNAATDVSLARSGVGVLTATGTFNATVQVQENGSRVYSPNNRPMPDVTAPINTQTGTTFTPVLADNGKWVTLNNASNIAVTIPTNASVAFPVGAEITFVALGAGDVTVTGAGGVTVHSPDGSSIPTQYSVWGLKQIAANVWVMFGRIG